MKRRQFVMLIGGAAATWPLAARAQHSAVPVIGFLHSALPESNVAFVAAFNKGLADADFIEGKTVAIEYRWAAGAIDRLPDLAADLVRRKVAIIATPGSTPAAFAAKAATATIPIVFAIGGDPVALGLVASLNRPGGNVTGISFESTEVAAKALSMLRELVPQAPRAVAIVNPQTEFTGAVVKNLLAAAAALSFQVDVVRASTDSDLEKTIADAAQRPGTAVLFGPDAFYTSRRAQIIALVARYALPAMYDLREFAAAGGLISYGPDLTNAYQEAGRYTGRVLKGEKPAEMPVMLPTKFQLVVNLKTAKALDIAVPEKLLALADEVIE